METFFRSQNFLADKGDFIAFAKQGLPVFKHSGADFGAFGIQHDPDKTMLFAGQFPNHPDAVFVFFFGPCEKLSRATFMPASIIFESISWLSMAGPIVQMILVLRFMVSLPDR
jgi:hypothetical protein